MENKKIDIITMGCSKNLVDSEQLIAMFANAGYDVAHNAESFRGDYVLINTCGFIGDAKEESINMILEAVQAKKNKAVKKVFVMGCLSERYRKELLEEIPEIDHLYGKFDWKEMASDLAKANLAHAPYERVITTPRHHAYIKIAEGCNRFCAFCAIPLITGRYKSRPIEEIIAEIKELVGRGVKEFNIIAQELTAYGTDIYGKQSIARLVDEIAAVPGVEWIRLHYAYPKDFPDDLLDAMARNANVCRYLDIALQHCSDKVLANMHRHITGEETRELLKKIRERVPGIHIRTTLMVGFPGETDKEFNELMEFVQEQRFERMGAFAYCEEEDTAAARSFADDIPQEVKQERLDAIMAVQERISLETNLAKVGKTMRVIIDSVGGEYAIGRTQFDSPEVDPEVLIPAADAKGLRPGDMIDVKITSATEFELYALPEETSSDK